MRTLFTLALLALPSLCLAQTPAAYEATHHGRVLSCYAEAYSVVELVDVATKNLYLVVAEAKKEATPERHGVVAGMLASGTLNDQQQALDVTTRLETCVSNAIMRAMPDAAAAFAVDALREELLVAIMMADGFASDYQQSAATLTSFLSTGGDSALLAATTGAYSGFAETVKATLTRTRIRLDELVEKTAIR
jgi:hypothetical protein